MMHSLSFAISGAGGAEGVEGATGTEGVGTMEGATEGTTAT